jgi:hypothetical protein
MRLTSMAMSLAAAVSAGPALGAPVVFGSHYEDFAQESCTGSCHAFFDAIPAGKVLIVTNVACAMISGAPIAAMDISVMSSMNVNSLMRSAALVPGPHVLYSGLYYSSLNQQTNFAIGGGRFPRIQFGAFSSAFSSLSCQISGVLFPNPGPGPTPGELN